MRIKIFGPLAPLFLALALAGCSGATSVNIGAENALSFCQTWKGVQATAIDLGQDGHLSAEQIDKIDVLRAPIQKFCTQPDAPADLDLVALVGNNLLEISQISALAMEAVR